MSSIEERLINCFSIIFPDLRYDEIHRANTTSVAGWDSLATVTIVSVIEEEFDITISPEEYEYMISFELIRECIKDKTINA